MNSTGGGAKQVNDGLGITNPTLGDTLTNLLSGGDPGIAFFQILLPNIVGLGLIAGAIIFFFMVLVGAIQWMLSGGDKGAIEAARGRITSALIGIFVLFATFAIISLVEGFFDINILTLDIGPLKIK